MPRRLRSQLIGALLLSACATTERRGPPPTAAQLEERCQTLERFRAQELAAADSGKERRALERWHPPAPVDEEDRPVLEAAARRWLSQCGRQATVGLTRELVAFETVGAEEPAATNRAFEAMADFLRRWARDAGMRFEVYGANDAWEIQLGDGPRKLGFVMHADVVPSEDLEAKKAAGVKSSTSALPPGWSHPPFAATVVGDKLFGRGVEDDKGPIAASLIAMQTMTRFGLRPHGQIVAVLGTGEESNWDGMKRYAEAKKAPPMMISVDAGFPVVVAESGFVAWQIGFKRGANLESTAPVKKARLVDARAGQFLTQVPGEASLSLSPAEGETLDALLLRARAAAEAEVAARKSPFRAQVEKLGDKVQLRTFGEAVHSSVADTGHNALWLLAAIAVRLDPAPGPIEKVLQLVAQRFNDDHLGKKLGLDYQHPLMGALLVTPTLLRVKDDQAVLSVNMRRPAGQSSKEFSQKLDQALSKLKQDFDPKLEEIGERYVGEAALAEVGGTLVPTLLEIYRQASGDAHAAPIAIRGGTYARLFPGAVSFGPSLPGQPYRGHAPDESIELSTLDLLLRVLFEAALKLDGR